MPRRTPAARPAARRPAARRSAGARSGQDSDDDGGESEPGESPGSPISLFARFHDVSAELTGTQRLSVALAMPRLERSLWRDLARLCDAQIDSELEAAGR